MDNQDRRKLLENLREQIAATEPINETGRARLQRLDQEVNELLAREGEPEGSDELFESWNESVTQFEAEHPTLALTISQLLTALSNAGI